MRPLLVLDVVGLTPAHLERGYAPRLAALARDGFAAPLRPVFPAVTCTVQSTLVTGKPPRDHGIVANGWLFRELAEVWLWRQSNRLVAGEKVWQAARRRDPSATCAWLFWWYAMAGDFDYVVTPRPAYHADGRKSPDVWTWPPELKGMLGEHLGRFPLFSFWGPNAGLPSSRWIASAALEVMRAQAPGLTFVYLPHLDYDLQRLGPDDPRIEAEVRAVDALAGELIDAAQARGAAVVALSEYGITAATAGVHVNKALREAGLLHVQDTLTGELLDPGNARAFAVADHQCAHVYVRDPADLVRARDVLARLDGVERVLDERGKAEFGLDHERSGELVLVAARDRWFTHDWWLDDEKAPDFARTVDIHKKPGYDPRELFLDPRLSLPRARIAWKLARKLMGFRTVLDVIPLDDRLVRGTHGRLPDDPAEGPVLVCSEKRLERESIGAADVHDLLLAAAFDGSGRERA